MYYPIPEIPKFEEINNKKHTRNTFNSMEYNKTTNIDNKNEEDKGTMKVIERIMNIRM